MVVPGLIAVFHACKEKFPKSEAKHAVHDVSKEFVGIVSAQNAGAGQNLNEDDAVGWLQYNFAQVSAVSFSQVNL